ncbi:MAG: diguanylate cyclase [Pseudohongiella sp.]|nr:diguanylate cyclase [Pseudohongiella sp.]
MTNRPQSSSTAQRPVAHRRQWKIRQLLLSLVLACLLPGIVVAITLYIREYLIAREQITNNLISTARAMVQTVDGQLVRALDVAQTLASFGGHDYTDFVGFQNWARRIITETNAGINVVLSDRNGLQLLNTLVPLEELPVLMDPPSYIEQVFSLAQPQITPIFTGALLQRPVLSVNVPVIFNDEAIYSLSIGILPSSFDHILKAQNFPDAWVAGIFDNTGTIVARTLQPELFVGQKGAADYIANINSDLEGWTQSATLEGIPVTSVWSRSATTNWSVGIGIPTGQLERDLRQRMIWLGVIILSMLLIAVLLAYRVASLIADSVRELRVPAAALGHGDDVHMPELRIVETAQVASDIKVAAELLRNRESELLQARESYLQQLEFTVEQRTSELRLANQQLELLALTDVMTGLSNRNAANARLRQAFVSFKRSGKQYAVLFLDIDQFKKVNDSYGHETGDQVLKQLAQTLQHSVRSNDFVARFGGEEFLALLEDCDLAAAVLVAEKIRTTVATQVFPLVAHVSISIGIAMVKPDDASEDDAVRRADGALFQAKSDGRNCVRHHT